MYTIKHGEYPEINNLWNFQIVNKIFFSYIYTFVHLLTLNLDYIHMSWNNNINNLFSGLGCWKGSWYVLGS